MGSITLLKPQSDFFFESQELKFSVSYFCYLAVLSLIKERPCLLFFLKNVPPILDLYLYYSSWPIDLRSNVCEYIHKQCCSACITLTCLCVIVFISFYLFILEKCIFNLFILQHIISSPLLPHILLIHSPTEYPSTFLLTVTHTHFNQPLCTDPLVELL